MSQQIWKMFQIIIYGTRVMTLWPRDHQWTSPTSFFSFIYLHCLQLENKMIQNEFVYSNLWARKLPQKNHDVLAKVIVTLCLLACAIYSATTSCVHSNLPASLLQLHTKTHIVIMLFWTFLCGKTLQAVKIVLFELWWHHILPDAILFYKLWHVETFLLWLFVCMHTYLQWKSFCRHAIRAHSEKKANIEFSALFDVKIKLQQWKFNKLPSTRFIKKSHCPSDV
jgi:hypothetical protein